jgi:transketolase
MASESSHVGDVHADTIATIEECEQLARRLRVDAIRAVAHAGSGHATSALSAADLMAVLLARHLRFDWQQPKDARNDRLVFSKGHASPLLYAMAKAAGAIGDDELLRYRTRGSRLEGHPTPALPFVDVATGSLGQGLPIGVGMALGARLLGTPTRVWVLCGDSEMSEGSMWEALEHAGHARLAALCAILDVNRLGQSTETMHGWDLDNYAARARLLGWHALTIEGHDLRAIDRAYAHAAMSHDAPTLIVARTEKGHGVAEVADRDGYHGKPLPHADEAIEAIDAPAHVEVRALGPRGDAGPYAPRARATTAGLRATPRLPRYDVGAKPIATRAAYGDSLVALGAARDDVVVLDAEVSNSTYSERFRAAFPERFIECYIAEQQMIAAAVGLQALGLRPFASTFAAFLSRADDFVRMAAISRAHLVVCGSHAGTSIGEDGPSQMGLADVAFFRAIHDSTVLHPCDANQTAALVALLVDHDGISYLRTLRGETPVIYPASTPFRIGGSHVLRAHVDDVVAVVATGVTVHEALAAANALERDDVHVRVIDAYSLKPLDGDTLRAAARDTGALLTVEDHVPEGGLGDAVLDLFAGEIGRPLVKKLAVRGMPGSAKPEEQRAAAAIDADAIQQGVRALLADRAH